MGPEAEAQVLAKLGRVYGNLCQYEDAEKAFMQSIDASAKAFGASSINSFPVRLELAQFSYDIGQYEKSVAYFDQAFSYGIAVIEKYDAPSYVAITKDYSDALVRTGRPVRATEAMSKVKLLEGKAAAQKGFCRIKLFSSTNSVDSIEFFPLKLLNATEPSRAPCSDSKTFAVPESSSPVSKPCI